MYAIIYWKDGKPIQAHNYDGEWFTFTDLAVADKVANMLDKQIFKDTGIENTVTVISLEGVKE